MALSPPLWFHCQRQKKSNPSSLSFSFLQRVAPLPRNNSHLFLHGAQSPESFSSVPILHSHLLCSSLSDSLAAGAELERGARGKPHSQPNQNVARSPAHPFPAKKIKTLSFSRKEPSPAQHGQGRGRWVGGGGGGGIWQKASFGNTLAQWQLEYYSFSARRVMDQSFLPIFLFPGGEPTYSFSRGIFFQK